MVNAFLIDDGDELALVDTGFPGDEQAILAAIQGLGKQPTDLRHILVTHCHVDHAGSLAALKRLTGAAAVMQPLDAEMVRSGQAWRDHVEIAPGIEKWLLYRLFMGKIPRTIPPAEIDLEVNDGDLIPAVGGVQVVHIPGHTAGQVAYIWQRHGGVAFVADAAGNIVGLRMSINYEDLRAGYASLAKLGRETFDLACFGHGRVLMGGAAQRFQRKWGGS
jgi:glyoxylase-like metal-dependent hydrolase (beta-lactamase superfamily II)